MIQVIPNKNLEVLIETLGSDFYLYNIDVEKENNLTTVKIGSSQILNGTIRFIYSRVNDEVRLKTSILTDITMYDACIDLINKFKDTENTFQASANFITNLGGNGMINVNVIVSDENINSIYKILELIEFKKKL